MSIERNCFFLIIVGRVILHVSRVQMLAPIVPSHQSIRGVSLSSIIADINKPFEGRPCRVVAHHNLMKNDVSAESQHCVFCIMSKLTTPDS